jgi:glutathione S-transferase
MMQLWYAPTSPFARKVRIAAHELGLADRIELVEVDPWSDARLRRLNPLAKVPTLVLPSGETLFESAVICEYLDALAGEGRLFPPPSDARWQALLLQGLADGASTAAGRLFAEQRRPGAEQSARMIARFEAAIEAALDEMERRGVDGGLATIGDVAAVAFLGYLDFRWPDMNWRGGRDGLAGAYAQARARVSLAQTIYRLPGEKS